MSELIDIKGKNKAEVLAKLYNASRPLGMGFLHFTPEDMTIEQAEKIIADKTVWSSELYFDYLQGRVMKVDLTKDTFNPWLYDRDNGQGAAARALSV